MKPVEELDDILSVAVFGTDQVCFLHYLIYEKLNLFVS